MSTAPMTPAKIWTQSEFRLASMAACAQNERTMPVQNTGSEFWPHLIRGASERHFRMGESCGRNRVTTIASAIRCTTREIGLVVGIERRHRPGREKIAEVRRVDRHCYHQ